MPWRRTGAGRLSASFSLLICQGITSLSLSPPSIPRNGHHELINDYQLRSDLHGQSLDSGRSIALLCVLISILLLLFLKRTSRPLDHSRGEARSRPIRRMLKMSRGFDRVYVQRVLLEQRYREEAVGRPAG